MTDQIVRSAPTLAVFDELSKGAPAPSWLRDGIVANVRHASVAYSASRCASLSESSGTSGSR